ncbi:acetyltransferase [Thiohalobacter sp. IOR34]|uniref:acetyltransferase n=1 Tax=Thiohalobacter sp. IOR34 TaxID=3057176 RepID=UPI0025B0FFD6|nr:acetyltransferase [Thiohalobacter sp. IOR34]WJW75902.1 acetyltransferase [Thiohalobacter sp. IOR34]
MFLKHVPTGDLVEVLDLDALFDPCKEAVSGRFHAGEELQDSSRFAKSELAFPSGEALPACWIDVDYKAHG